MNATTPRLALQPGVYVLTQDVTNPHPDSRCKRDWRKIAWQKGMRLVCTASHMCPGRIELHLLGGWTSNTIMDTPRDDNAGGAQVRALLPFLRREPETLGTFKTMADSFDAEDILAAFIDKGLLTLDEIKTMHAQLAVKLDASYSDVATPARTDARVFLALFRERHGLHGNKVSER